MTPSISDILARPYARTVIPDPDGGFTAEIVEFPGCIAMGDTAAEALEILEDVAADWIGAAIEQGQDIPEPMYVDGERHSALPRIQITLERREDGGLRVYSNDLPGLVLSGPDADQVGSDIWPAIRELWRQQLCTTAHSAD